MNDNLSQKIMLAAKKVFLSLCLLLVVTFVWTGVAFTSISSANAVILSQSHLIATVDPNAVDNVFGAGTNDKLKGKAQEDIGTVKQNLGKVQGQTEEVDEQIKGRAQQDIGEVKRSSEEAGSDLDNASENVVDAIKHFFGQ